MTASITARQGFVGRLFESMKNNDKGRCVVLFLNKKKLFQLDRRLQTCASMVRENHVLADIGTDHAYLPIWLVKKEVIKKAIASDINMGPLQKAAFNIRRYNVGKQVDARLSDGLELIFPNEADDIVIAGMGGELIADIIEKAPWLKDAEKLPHRNCAPICLSTVLPSNKSRRCRTETISIRLCRRNMTLSMYKQVRCFHT